MISTILQIFDHIPNDIEQEKAMIESCKILSIKNYRKEDLYIQTLDTNENRNYLLMIKTNDFPRE